MAKHASIRRLTPERGGVDAVLPCYSCSGRLRDLISQLFGEVRYGSLKQHSPGDQQSMIFDAFSYVFPGQGFGLGFSLSGGPLALHRKVLSRRLAD